MAGTLDGHPVGHRIGERHADLDDVGNVSDRGETLVESADDPGTPVRNATSAVRPPSRAAAYRRTDTIVRHVSRRS